MAVLHSRVVRQSRQMSWLLVGVVRRATALRHRDRALGGQLWVAEAAGRAAGKWTFNSRSNRFVSDACRTGLGLAAGGGLSAKQQGAHQQAKASCAKRHRYSQHSVPGTLLGSKLGFEPTFHAALLVCSIDLLRKASVQVCTFLEDRASTGLADACDRRVRHVNIVDRVLWLITAKG